MAQLPSYDFRTNETQFDYRFESTGPQGIIHKAASFIHLGENFFQFGFGDLDENEVVSDTIISNNGDIRLILVTVAKIKGKISTPSCGSENKN